VTRPVGEAVDHRELLRRAREQADERGLDDVLIVDADFHQVEGDAWGELLEHMDNDVVRHFLREGGRGKEWIPAQVNIGGIQQVAGRIRGHLAWYDAATEQTGAARDLTRIRETMELMGTDYVSIFPTTLLTLAVTKFADLETHLGRAYASWLTERVLAEEPRILSMLFLPFADPEASLRLVEEFGDRPGVIGFMITSTRFDPTYAKPYMKLYRALEERGLPLGFHSGFAFGERSMQQFNRFVSVHSLGFPLYNMIQATNWIVNGMPERFPDLKVVFIEGGLAWVPFVMRRLDHEVMMRPSEAPLLQRLPSEYMREFFYTSQPLEATTIRDVQETFELIDADTQLLWASDWPHWDWDPPARIWDLPFLTDQARRQILGGNAARLFGLDGRATAPRG
jgi:uncharacterized protein